MNVDGLVLAGGRSSRFGSDKAGATLGGRTLLSISYRTVAGAVGGAVYLAGAGQAGPRDLAPAVLRIVDECSGAGPLGGIAAALGRSRRAGVVVLACDLPLVKTSTLVRMATLGLASGRAVAARTSRGWEPLAAFYPRTALQQLRSGLREGPRALHLWLDKLGALAVTGIAGDELTNINRPRDLERLTRG